MLPLGVDTVGVNVLLVVSIVAGSRALSADIRAFELVSRSATPRALPKPIVAVADDAPTKLLEAPEIETNATTPATVAPAVGAIESVTVWLSIFTPETVMDPPFQPPPNAT